MFTEKQYNILERCHKQGGIIINENEQKCLESLISIGWLNNGMADEDNQYKPTISFTPLGKSMFERERIYRSPVKKFFYELFAPLGY